MHGLLWSFLVMERTLQSDESAKQHWAKERRADSDKGILPGEKGSTDGSLGTADTQNKDSFVAQSAHNQTNLAKTRGYCVLQRQISLRGQKVDGSLYIHKKTNHKPEVLLSLCHCRHKNCMKSLGSK